MTDQTPTFEAETALAHCSTSWLATAADALFPNSKEAENFLDRVLNDVIERADDLLSDEDDANDIVHEIADNAVPIYTHDLWTCFVDLGAYNEDMGDLGGATEDMTKNAQICLYMMAERVAHILVQNLSEAKEEWDEEHECLGHESLAGEHMGEEVFCDGSCRG